MQEPQPSAASVPETFAFRPFDEIEQWHALRVGRLIAVVGVTAVVHLVFNVTDVLGLVSFAAIVLVGVFGRLARWRRKKSMSPHACAVRLGAGSVVLPAEPHSERGMLEVGLDEVRAVYTTHFFGRHVLVIEHPATDMGTRSATKYGSAWFRAPGALEDLESALLARLRERGCHEVVERSEATRDFLGARRELLPVATLGALVVLTAAYFVQSQAGATEAASATSFAQYEQSLRMGALSTELVEQGQWFRLVVAAMWHGNTSHLLANLLGIGVSGAILEWMIGRTRWFILATACVVASFASLALFDTTWFGVGASGLGYGFLSALAVLWLRFRRQLPQSAWLLMAPAVVVLTGSSSDMLVNPEHGVVRGLANVNLAHVGGAVAGALVAAAFVARSRTQLPRLASGASVRLTSALCALVLIANIAWAAVYHQSDAYVADLNEVVLVGIGRFDGHDDLRLEALSGFAGARLERDSAGKAELEAARELLERAQEIDPTHQESRRRLDEVQARLAGR